MNKIDDQRPESGNLIDGLGPLAFASRLKRLQDRLLRDAKRIYRELDSEFQPRWFLPFYALSSRSQVSITQLAASLSLSHAAVNHMAKELIDAGFVAESRDTHDDRKRLLSLTDEGYAMADKLSPVWSAFRSATQELFEDSGCDMVKCLSALERALDHKGIYERVMLQDGMKANVDIVDYRSSHKKHFKSLNYEWLQDLFGVEPDDEKLLSDPRGLIINRGGAIVFAMHNDEVVGTCALLKHDEDTYELAKMAVTKSRRGHGIGRLLAQAVISRAQKAGCKSLILLTADVLKPAIALYESLGFVRSSRGIDLAAKYDRCTISMEMQLEPKNQDHKPHLER